MRRLLVVLALLGGWAAVGVGLAVPALAHAQVLATDPADGARLAAAPHQVTITFSENVGIDVGFLKVVDGRGRPVSTGAPSHPNGKGDTVSVTLATGLGDGSYIVSWRVVSADSHPVAGAISFVVGSGPLLSTGGTALGGTTDPVVGATFDVVRWLSFAGVVLLGGLVFVVVCWPAGRDHPRTRRLLWAGWGTTAGAAVLGVLVEGPYAAGSGLPAARNADLVRATLSTTYGKMLSARLIALAFFAVFMQRLLADRAARRGDSADPDVDTDRLRAWEEDIAAIAGLAILATYGGSGHAVTGSQATVALLSDTVHLCAVVTWLGGLVLLACCLLPSRRTLEMAAALPRFSRLAFGCVITLAVTGTYQAWREVGTLPALWSTGYGQLVLAKAGGLVLLVAVANVSRTTVRRRYAVPPADLSTPAVVGAGVGGAALAVVPVGAAAAAEADSGRGTGHGGPVEARERDGAAALDGPDPPADEAGERWLRRRLRGSVGLELAIAAAVLAVAAVLVAAVPARNTYVRPVERTVVLASGGTARLSVTPARQGLNVVAVTVFDGGGRPLNVPDVTLSAELPAEQIGPLALPLAKVGPGRYQSTGASLPRPGSWQLVVRVRTSEFDVSVAQAAVPVR